MKLDLKTLNLTEVSVAVNGFGKLVKIHFTENNILKMLSQFNHSVERNSRL